MEITYLGHSAFRVRGRDVAIVTDPYPPSLGLAMGKPTASVVTVSRPTPNHSYIEGVGGEPRVLRGPGEYEVAGVLIAGIATAREPKVGTINTAYVLRFEDLAICHLGDVAGALTNQQVEDIGDINVLMIPVGGGSGLGAAAAKDVAAQLTPQVIVPMHYKVDGAQVDGLETVDHFMHEMGSKEFQIEPKLTVTKSSIGQEVRVVVLENRKA